jgi:hypothetical protein
MLRVWTWRGRVVGLPIVYHHQFEVHSWTRPEHSRTPDRAGHCSAGLALGAVHVVEWLTGDHCVDPIDEPGAVDLHLVEHSIARANSSDAPLEPPSSAPIHREGDGSRRHRTRRDPDRNARPADASLARPLDRAQHGSRPVGSGYVVGLRLSKAVGSTHRRPAARPEWRSGSRALGLPSNPPRSPGTASEPSSSIPVPIRRHRHIRLQAVDRPPHNVRQRDQPCAGHARPTQRGP